MPVTVDPIVEETRRRPANQVDALMEHLLASHYRLTDPATEAAWADEIKRRIDDIESGSETGIPSEEPSAKIRKIVGL
jgi:putative addiction module component (TIGR02574 family)